MGKELGEAGLVVRPRCESDAKRKKVQAKVS